MAAVGCSSSYLSQDEQTLHFGLGDSDYVESLRIVWPDGAEEIHYGLAADREIVFQHHATYPVRVGHHTASNEARSRTIQGPAP